ncbi:MAG TPA: ABC transporter permease [Acidimicrobiales bacterium]|nr:ABC transporter permease [Acidimicrobiales bacterium]
MRGILAYGRFEGGRLLRSWRFLVITVGFPVTFYLLFLGDRRASETVSGAVTWRVYLMVSMCSFGCLVAGLTAGGGRLAAERASGWARQLRVTPIPPWSFVVVKTATCMLVMIPVLGLVEAVAAVFGGVDLPFRTWLETAAAMWVGSLPFAELGVLIGFGVGVETTFPIIVALMFVLGYFGGLFNPVRSMPHPLQTAAHLLPSFHHVRLGLAAVSGGGFPLTSWLVLAGYAAAIAVAIAAGHRIDELRGTA